MDPYEINVLQVLVCASMGFLGVIHALTLMIIHECEYIRFFALRSRETLETTE